MSEPRAPQSGRQPGKHPVYERNQRAKRQRAGTLTLDPDLELFWDPEGVLFYDDDLTKPAGLRIVRAV
jgi:hypothetical protein